MAKGVNKVIIVGNLGNDPEVSATQKGSPMTRLRIATAKTWNDKATGKMQEYTEWHNVMLFERMAEVAGKYLKKGAKVYVEGSLRSNKWEKDGVTHYSTSIIANDVQFLGGGTFEAKDTSKVEDSPKSEGMVTPDMMDNMFDDIPF